MTSMTYGEMPTRGEWADAWARELAGRDYTYNITLSSSDSMAVDSFRLSDGDWTETALYDACMEIVETEDSIIPHNGCDVTPEALLALASNLEGAVCPVCGEAIEWRTEKPMDLVSSVLSTLGFEWI